MSTNINRVFGLDLMRAVAIILVLIVHSNGFLREKYPEFLYFNTPDGVEIFFVLSGFLIGGILLREFEKGSKTLFTTVLHFWKRRWFRTIPAYYIVLILNIILAQNNLIQSNAANFNPKFLVFFQNFYTYDIWFFYESWSLAVEEWFYIFLPLLSIMYFAFIKDLKKAFLLSSLTLVLAPILYRVSIDIGLHHSSADWEVLIRKIVICRFDALGIGLIFSYFIHYYEDLFFKLRSVLLLAAFALLIFLMNYHKDNGFYLNVVYLFITPLCFGLCLPFCYFWKKVNLKAFKFIEHVSVISYALYLLHMPIASFVYLVLKEKLGLTPELEYITFWLATLFIATLFYKYIEKPITDLRDKF